jgi:hypothetical protein
MDRALPMAPLALVALLALTLALVILAFIHGARRLTV